MSDIVMMDTMCAVLGCCVRRLHSLRERLCCVVFCFVTRLFYLFLFLVDGWTAWWTSVRFHFTSRSPLCVTLWVGMACFGRMVHKICRKWTTLPKCKTSHINHYTCQGFRSYHTTNFCNFVNFRHGHIFREPSPNLAGRRVGSSFWCFEVTLDYGSLKIPMFTKSVFQKKNLVLSCRFLKFC